MKTGFLASAETSVSFFCLSKAMVILYLKSLENSTSWMETDSFDFAIILK